MFWVFGGNDFFQVDIEMLIQHNERAQEKIENATKDIVVNRILYGL